MSQVVILSSQSILTEGVAARLKHQWANDAVAVVDACRETALAEILAAHPAIVVLDATDVEVRRCCGLSTLFDALPDLTLLRLKPELDEVQVVSAERRELGQVHDLVDVIQTILSMRSSWSKGGPSTH